MKPAAKPLAIFFATLFFTRIAIGDASTISNRVEAALLDYHTLCDQAVSDIFSVYTEVEILDPYPVLFAGWIHATNAIPILLDIVDRPSRLPFGKRHIIKRVSGSSINPLYIPSGPYPPVSPTPAAGALAALPLKFPAMTNLIEQAGGDTNRAAILAWTAMAHFGGDFGTVLEQKAEAGLEPWGWIQGLRTNEWEASPTVCLNRYRPHFKHQYTGVYTNLFHELRGLADQCEGEGDAATLEFVKDAMEEIGHPHEEDPSRWP